MIYSKKRIDLNKFQLNKNKKIITNSNQNPKPILNNNDKVRYIQKTLKNVKIDGFMETTNFEIFSKIFKY